MVRNWSRYYRRQHSDLEGDDGREKALIEDAFLVNLFQLALNLKDLPQMTATTGYRDHEPERYLACSDRR